jgi:hypothetical protein
MEGLRFLCAWHDEATIRSLGNGHGLKLVSYGRITITTDTNPLAGPRHQGTIDNPQKIGTDHGWSLIKLKLRANTVYSLSWRPIIPCRASNYSDSDPRVWSSSEGQEGICSQRNTSAAWSPLLPVRANRALTAYIMPAARCPAGNKAQRLHVMPSITHRLAPPARSLLCVCASLSIGLD